MDAERDAERPSIGAPEPREEASARTRLALHGAAALADDELLTLVTPRLKKKTERALALGLKGLAQLDLDGLIAELGVRPTDAARLMAAVELGRRCLAATEARPRLVTPFDIYQHVLHRFGALRCEEFRVLCFNARSVLVKETCVARGSTTHSQVDPREVFAPAVAARASAVVLVHNHPSGDPEPSQLDVSLTLQLRDAGRSLCIRVLDHLVLGDAGYVSLAQRGLFRDDLSGPIVAPRVHQR
jgi:DNA repair protein RadC